jgi:putative DNA primase/helicase
MYIMDKTHWRRFETEELKAWMADRVLPAPSTAEMQELHGRITNRTENLRKEEWINHSTEGYMNFANGVLCLATGEMEPHSSKFGFMHVIPYNYDPRAECPRWDKFMLEITNGDQSIVDVMTEFGGYALAGGECTAQKALMVMGEGANGKSLWAETLAKVVGDRNFSSVFLNDLRNEQMRVQLQHKLFNYSDEGSSSLRASNEFKSLVSGGYIQAKEVYKPAFNFKNRAKLIVLTNNLPDGADTSDGFFRRFIIIHLTKQFKGKEDNKSLRNELWQNELPGICNRFIQGFNRLAARNYEFTESSSINTALDEFITEMNPAERFAAEELILTGNPNDELKTREVYARYMTWCMATGHKPAIDKVFFKDLRRSKVMKDCEFSRRVYDGVKLGVISGVRLGEEF